METNCSASFFSPLASLALSGLQMGSTLWSPCTATKGNTTRKNTQNLTSCTRNVHQRTARLKKPRLVTLQVWHTRACRFSTDKSLKACHNSSSSTCAAVSLQLAPLLVSWPKYLLQSPLTLLVTLPRSRDLPVAGLQNTVCMWLFFYVRGRKCVVCVWRLFPYVCTTGSHGCDQVWIQAPLSVVRSWLCNRNLKKKKSRVD